MSTMKKCIVVMLSTKEKAHRGDMIINPHFEPNKLLIFEHSNSTEVAQHLYILSDEEIKEGDWFVTESNKILKAESKDFPDNDPNNLREFGYKKIIATTDSSLTKTNFKVLKDLKSHQLPKPSDQFLEVYVKAYNEGKQIQEVMVKCKEKVAPSGDFFNPDIIQEILVNPKDNTITIKRVKDSWNREEIRELLYKYDDTSLTYSERTRQETNEWLDKNLY